MRLVRTLGAVRRRLPATLAICAAAFAPGHAMASEKGWATASSVGRDALVVAALGIPAIKGDWRGDLQTGGSILAAGGATSALKELIPERRPDGSDRRSFPSGHTSVSFAAAASLEKRYGWHLGAPALAVAGFVGAARVAADKHYVHDVVVGAAIGSAAGLLLTSRRNERVRLVPWGDAKGGGVVVSACF